MHLIVTLFSGRTIQRNLSLQHHRNPEPRRISRQNSLLDRFRLRKRQESAPVIIANESSVPSVRNRPLSLAVYNIPEEEPGAGPGALVVTPRSLPPTPMVQRKPEDLSQYPTEPICYDSSDEEDTEVIQPSPPLGYVPPDLSAFDEPISLPTNKEVAGKFEGVNPPDFSVLDEPIHNEAPHTLRSKDDMNPPDFSVLDEPICHDEMSPETKKAGTSEDPPDFSVLDKPICLAANNIEEVPKAEIPTIVVVEKSEDGPPDFSVLDDPIPLSGAEDVPRTLPDTTLPSLALAAPLLEENSNSNPPDFSVLNEPISSHVGDIDEASEVVLPGKENHSQLENYVPPDFSAFDEPICLPTDEEMPETSQDPQIEKKADFSAFDEPILFPSNLPPPSAEKKANYTPDFSAFDQHHSSDDQEESVLPLHSLPSLPLLVEGTSEEINIPPGFSVFNDLALKDIDPGSTGILSGGPDENFGSIFDQIEDVLSQDDNQMPLSTVGADTKIAVAKERETIMADSQLPAPIEGRTFTWDKLRSMLDESDSMPPESSTVVCIENQEWMKHTSGIEQLRSFLEVSD